MSARNREIRLDVVHLGRSARRSTDFYHVALASSWPRFMGAVLAAYLAINAVFAFGYYFCGREAFDGMIAPDGWQRWMECFFFSVQTVGTIGYGKVSPIAYSSNLLVTAEALVGLLSLAVVTGLFFSRFSRPTARVVFSNVALIAPHDGTPSLIFRIANERRSQIVDASVQVSLIRNEKTAEGESFYTFIDMKLERTHSPVFAASWTVVHPIDESSPLYQRTREQLILEEAQIVVSISGIDEIFGQPVRARFSYEVEELVWNHRFVDMLEWKDPQLYIHLDRIHQVEPIGT